jgi:large subunit ribosomal protein L24
MRKIRKGDEVEVIAGACKGQKGVVKMASDERVILENVNLVKKHLKPSQMNQKGGISQVEAPISISNVMLVKNGVKSRVGIKVMPNGERVRFIKKNGEVC